MRISNVLLVVLLSGLLSACGGLRSVAPNHSTLSEVRAKAGNPTDIRFDRDGDELWEYGGGLRGTETYLVRAGKDGRVKSVTQIRTESQFYMIQPGQATKEDARHLLGQPSDQSFLLNGTSWSWRAQISGERVQLVVHFDAKDVVLDKIIISDSGGDGTTRGESSK
ncbi:MAG TPA: hypothetical protein VD839_08015 [Burkholderiales bacterium]|nr:hypothetical protein [Burkholderiales bacterium]